MHLDETFILLDTNIILVIADSLDQKSLTRDEHVDAWEIVLD